MHLFAKISVINRDKGNAHNILIELHTKTTKTNYHLARSYQDQVLCCSHPHIQSYPHLD